MKRTLVVFAVALSILTPACRRRESPSTFAGAPVIIISIDTMRADHLPMFGYKEVDTPALDALRKDSILFTSAYATSPLTLPSHASMLTGLLPPDSKVRNNIGYALDPSIPTIPKSLKAIGYDTGGAISAYVLRGNIGLSQSFDFYDDAIASRSTTAIGLLQRAGPETVNIAERWIGEHKSRPLFFFLHLFEPHSPYEPVEPFKSRYGNAYDGEIATADWIVGQFVDVLKRAGLYDKAIVILMSDHGEGLYQHGEPEHGIFLYRETLHVPLLVKLPGALRAGESDGAPVSLIDLFPTITELTGAARPAAVKGKSLLYHEPADRSRRVYAESLYPRIHLGWSELRSLIGSDYQFIQAPTPELYNLADDPGQIRNIVSSERRTYASMRDELGAYGSRMEPLGQINPEEAKKLAALGYLGSNANAGSGPLPDPKDRITEIAEVVGAAQLARSGHNDEAIDAFRRILSKNGRLADAWNQLGDVLELTGRYEEAAEAYRKAIRATPELAGEFGLRLGSVLLRLQKYDEAEEHAALGEKTNAASSHLLRARIAFARKQYVRAEQQAVSAQNDEYSRAGAMVLIAQVYAEQDRTAEALALIGRVEQEAVSRRSGPVESLEFVRGDALARMQRYDEAIAAFRREIVSFPRNGRPYASLYVVYMLTNRPAEARAALVELAAANPITRTFQFAASTADALGDREIASLWRQRAGEK
ncbi:MAG TPA: sulfatase-like hydrolase/transferase [Gemmatimonadaceae bacterium]|nr:sulfatase-like hydrolase/transferase [Gemmatimonadaceae bacterium]